MQRTPLLCKYANIKECSIKLLTVSHQRHLKSVFKYSLGQQNNIATTLSRVLPWRYVANFEHVRTRYNLHIMTNIFKWLKLPRSRCHVLISNISSIWTHTVFPLIKYPRRLFNFEGLKCCAYWRVEYSHGVSKLFNFFCFK